MNEKGRACVCLTMHNPSAYMRHQQTGGALQAFKTGHSGGDNPTGGYPSDDELSLSLGGSKVAW